MMSRNSCTRWARVLLLACAGAALAACGGGGGGGSKSTTGVLKLGITDAPVDGAQAVVIQFTGVELKPVNGSAFSIDFQPPNQVKQFDMLTLQNGQRAMLLDGQAVPAGDYEWMRLKVQADPNVAGDSYVLMSDGECEIRIPSGAETGLKLVNGFTIGIGGITDFTVDFDLRKSLVAPPGQHSQVGTCGGQVYLLKPALRMTNNLEVGTIAGTIDATLIAQQCGSGATLSGVAPGNVYLFGPYADGTTPPTPDDYDGVGDPLASAMVKNDGSGAYVLGYVPKGNYVVAYTCSVDETNVDANTTGVTEVVTFTPATGTGVTVTAGQTSPVNFTVPVGP
jgi:hypothetical protein